MAVSEIAMGSGKKIAKIGSKTVPSPNPEKNVKIEAKKAVKQMSGVMLSAFYKQTKISTFSKVC